MTERASYPWFMIMVLIVTVRPQSIFLVVRRVARYELVRVYSVDLGAPSFLLYRRTRVLGTGSHAYRIFHV